MWLPSQQVLWNTDLGSLLSPPTASRGTRVLFSSCLEPTGHSECCWAVMGAPASLRGRSLKDTFAHFFGILQLLISSILVSLLHRQESPQPFSRSSETMLRSSLLIGS